MKFIEETETEENVFTQRFLKQLFLRKYIKWSRKERTFLCIKRSRKKDFINKITDFK